LFLCALKSDENRLLDLICAIGLLYLNAELTVLLLILGLEPYHVLLFLTCVFDLLLVDYLIWHLLPLPNLRRFFLLRLRDLFICALLDFSFEPS